MMTSTHQLDFTKCPSPNDLNFFKVFRLHLKVSGLFNDLLIWEQSKENMNIATKGPLQHNCFLTNDLHLFKKTSMFLFLRSAG